MSEDDLFVKADQLYELGNYEEAFNLFLQAASLGDVSSMTRVALMYADGCGIASDIEKSLEWDLRAASKGDASGALNAGVTYSILGNLDEAISNLSKSLELGNGEAALILAKLNQENKKNALKYLNIAINHVNISDESRDEAKKLKSDI